MYIRSAIRLYYVRVIRFNTTTSTIILYYFINAYLPMCDTYMCIYIVTTLVCILLCPTRVYCIVYHARVILL